MAVILPVNRFCTWLAVLLCVTACGSDRNEAPILAPIGDGVFEVGVGGAVQLQSFDADGDPLIYSFTINPVPPSFADEQVGRPRIVPLTQGALFSWTPSVEDALGDGRADYVVRFSVEDPSGARSERSMKAGVLDPGVAGGGLRFTAPAGEGIYVDAACLGGLDVSVGGGDENRDTILEIEVPASARCAPGDPDCNGLQITRRGPGDYTVDWCPTARQLAQTVHFPLRLTARMEGSDAVIRKRFFLRYELTEAANCVGDVPRIEGVQAKLEGDALDYPVDALISDDFGFKVPPVLVYRRGQGQLGTPSFHGWGAVTFERVLGDLWMAAIPNDGTDTAATVIEYAIVAGDDDDAESTRCDHVAKTSVFTVNPPAEGGAEKTLRPCRSCRSDAQCGGAGDLCVSLVGEGHCGHGCVGQSDCESGELCLLVESVEGRAGYQCVPANLDCGQLCLADGLEGLGGNESRGNARFIEPGVYPGLSICGDDVDYYRIRAESGQRVFAEVTLTGDQGDLDLAMFLGGAETPTYASLDGQATVEAVNERCLEAGGDIYLAVWAAGGAENTYDLRVDVGDGECEVPCAADPVDTAGGNESLETAHPLPPSLAVEGYTLCGDDLDFYAFDADAGTSIAVDLGFLALTGDLGLRLFRDGVFVAESSSLRDGERLKVYSAVAGRFTVEVFGQGPHPSTPYDLSITLTAGTDCTASTACPEGLACIEQTCADPRCDGPDVCGLGDACIGERIGGVSGQVTGACVILCNESRDCRSSTEYACKRVGSGRGACFLPGAQPTGGRCTRHQDCAGQSVCYAWPNGYCAALGCDVTPCPNDTRCETINGDAVCLATCESNGDCRSAEGYVCRALRPGEPKTCRPDF